MIEIIIGATILVVGTLWTIGWGIGTYNLLNYEKQDVEEMWSNVKTEYQRRADLIMNLVETVKAHAKFEKETLTNITLARKGVKAKTKKGEIEILQKVDKAMLDFYKVTENYPELKSSKHYTKLMDELKETEDRVNVSRTSYNQEVKEYNNVVITFPSKIIAEKYNFKIEKYYEVPENAAPEIMKKIDLTM